MRIENIEITKLGFFKHIKLELSPERLNIIAGENGSGKTTILAVLYAMLQDRETIEYSGEDETAQVSLSIKEGNEICHLKKNYNNKTTELVVPSLHVMKRIASLDQSKVHLYSGEFLNYDYTFTNVMIKNAVKLLDTCGVNDTHFIKGYSNFNSNYHYMSGSIQAVIRILNMLSQVQEGSVLLLDAPFAMLDRNAAQLILEVIRHLQIQVILTANVREGSWLEGNKIFLERSFDQSYYGQLRFDYKELFYHDMKALTDTQKNDMESGAENKIIKYRLGQEVEEPESRNIEYKEIKGNHPCNSMIDVAEIYINAFLNSHTTGIGVIKWGISDDGIVKGVCLSKKDRDVIDRKISERIGQMKPYVSSDVVQISYENILDGDNIAKDLFIVEVIVRPWTGDVLFSTSKGEVYIKTEGGKLKLDAYGLQEELLGRRRKSRYTI